MRNNLSEFRVLIYLFSLFFMLQSCNLSNKELGKIVVFDKYKLNSGEYLMENTISSKTIEEYSSSETSFMILSNKLVDSSNLDSVAYALKIIDLNVTADFNGVVTYLNFSDSIITNPIFANIIAAYRKEFIYVKDKEGKIVNLFFAEKESDEEIILNSIEKNLLKEFSNEFPIDFKDTLRVNETWEVNSTVVIQDICFDVIGSGALVKVIGDTAFIDIKTKLKNNIEKTKNAVFNNINTSIEGTMNINMEVIISSSLTSFTEIDINVKGYFDNFGNKQNFVHQVNEKSVVRKKE